MKHNRQKRVASKHALSFDPSAISENLQKALNRDLGVSVIGKFSHTLLYNDKYDNITVDKLRQVMEFHKKLSLPGCNTQSVLHKQAVNNFLQHNAYCKTLGLALDLPDKKLRQVDWNHSLTFNALIRSRLLLEDMLANIDMEDVFAECRHSSGTTIGLKFAKTNLEDKWKFPLTCTKEVLPLFMIYLDYDPQLRNWLIEYNQVSEINESCFQIVPGSRLTTVEKNDESRRTIAVEPTVNMFFQLAVFAVLARILKRFNLDLSVLQEKHQSVVAIASLDGLLGTLDLHGASDSVLCELVENQFPAPLFSLLNCIRCKFIEVDGKIHSLHMYATMGNATTFPVETLIFYALARSTQQSYRKWSIPEWDRFTNVSVFGDDIIAPAFTMPFLITVLENVGFTINTEKSFFGDEEFRESCGADYFRGRNIRPYYLRSPHNLKHSSMEPWLYIIFNRLLKKYISYFGASVIYMLHHKFVFRYLFKLFRKHKFKIKFVPFDYPDDSGIQLLHEFPSIIGFWPVENIYDEISRDANGSLIIHYSNFQYAAKFERYVTYSASDYGPVRLKIIRRIGVHDPFHYWMDLKKLQALNEKTFVDKCRDAVEKRYNNKRIGGYVVGKAVIPQG